MKGINVAQPIWPSVSNVSSKRAKNAFFVFLALFWACVWVSHLVVLCVRKMTKICRPSWRNDPNWPWQEVTKLFNFFHSSWWWNNEIIFTKIKTIGKVGIKNGRARVSNMTSFGFWQLHNWVAKWSAHPITFQISNLIPRSHHF